jgi:hypothetical protein
LSDRAVVGSVFIGSLALVDWNETPRGGGFIKRSRISSQTFVLRVAESQLSPMSLKSGKAGCPQPAAGG